MKFQRRVRQDIDVNMTPLIDVVFLLLIFFMVSTTFTKESRLGINLPKAEIGDVAPQKLDVVEVLIDANGIYKVDGNTLSNNDLITLKAGLNKALKTKLAEQQDNSLNVTKPRLTITADAATPHQFVVTTMDVAGQLGFSKLSITTLKKEPQ